MSNNSFKKNDNILIRTLSRELFKSIVPAFNVKGKLNLVTAERVFEKRGTIDAGPIGDDLS